MRQQNTMTISFLINKRIYYYYIEISSDVLKMAGYLVSMNNIRYISST